jgi:hypothetical protein
MASSSWFAAVATNIAGLVGAAGGGPIGAMALSFVVGYGFAVGRSVDGGTVVGWSPSTGGNDANTWPRRVDAIDSIWPYVSTTNVVSTFRNQGVAMHARGPWGAPNDGFKSVGTNSLYDVMLDRCRNGTEAKKAAAAYNRLYKAVLTQADWAKTARVIDGFYDHNGGRHEGRVTDAGLSSAFFSHTLGRHCYGGSLPTSDSRFNLFVHTCYQAGFKDMGALRWNGGPDIGTYTGRSDCGVQLAYRPSETNGDPIVSQNGLVTVVRHMTDLKETVRDTVSGGTWVTWISNRANNVGFSVPAYAVILARIIWRYWRSGGDRDSLRQDAQSYAQGRGEADTLSAADINLVIDDFFLGREMAAIHRRNLARFFLDEMRNGGVSIDGDVYSRIAQTGNSNHQNWYMDVINIWDEYKQGNVHEIFMGSDDSAIVWD